MPLSTSASRGPVSKKEVSPMSDEEERLRQMRSDLALRLSECLNYALGAGLSSEAALIAKLIEATLTNTTTKLYIKLTSH